jgi:hypothetical protein
MRVALWKHGLSILPLGLRDLFRLRSFAIVALATSVHFVHVFIVSQWSSGTFTLGGSPWLYRMGFTPAVASKGQGSYDYTTITQAISFIWRQSEFIQITKNFPSILDVEHVLFWGLGIAGGIALLFQVKDITRLTLLMLVLLPGFFLTFFLNQSASAHPDYYSFFWHPALVIGWTSIIFKLLHRVPRSSLDQRFLVVLVIGWAFFLWQIRYFLVAYPFAGT